MAETLTIALGQLFRGGETLLDELLQPDLFEIFEEELRFDLPIQVKGRAYVVDDNLVVHFSAKTKAKMICSVCNEWCEVPLEVEGCHTTELAKIKGDKWDVGAFIREELLLQVPTYAECESSCPDRKQIAKYLKRDGGTNLSAAFEEFTL